MRGQGGVVARDSDHGASDEATVIRCVDWFRARGREASQELWDGIHEIAVNAKRPSVRLRARQMLADRIDPIPKAPTLEVHTGPVNIAWTSSSPTPLVPSRHSSMPPLNGNGHVLRSSSATDALESL